MVNTTAVVKRVKEVILNRIPRKAFENKIQQLK